MTDQESNPDKPPTPASPPLWVKVLAGALVVWIAFLISWIVLKGSDIGTPASAQSALIAANERLLQMVQWTIATVLTLGGALIGLNWYQGEKRYEHDKHEFEARVQTLEEQTARRLSYLELANTATLEMLTYQGVAQALGDPEDLQFVSRSINYFRTSDSVPMRRATATILIEYAKAATGSHPTHFKRSYIPTLRDFIPELSRQFPELGSVLASALASDIQEAE